MITLTGIAVFAGCNKEGVPGLVKGEGIVTWKGEPVEGAMVGFSPKGQGRSAFGITDANGKFKATTLNADDGIMPGEYDVTVEKMTATRGTPPPEDDDPNASREGRNAPPPREERQVTYFIPQVYADKGTSGLTATISSSGNKDLLFELVGEIQHRPAR